jgi:hypothetical protein
MDKIIKAIPLENHTIEILTSSGISGIFDVKPYLHGTAFKELINESYFCLVRPAHHGIAWPHEQDFSSDTIIYDIQNTTQRQPTTDDGFTDIGIRPCNE